MKKRLLTGTLILTIFLVSLIPASVRAWPSWDDVTSFSVFKITGKGTASIGEINTKIIATFLLGATNSNIGTIEGMGKGTLMRVGISDMVSGLIGGGGGGIRFKVVGWSFDRYTKTLEIFGSTSPDVTIRLTGVIASGYSGPRPIDEAELSGTLTVGTKTFVIALSITICYTNLEFMLT